ncbi:LPP20 family lipoprotein [Helicobacter ailurogastricus]|uniref:Putative lipoprotein required for motility n=1 Tax=Helicobacter ailurogastricus TaxID=1578720 RepID=A0A0K2X6U7_9HELI|nr:LPP20 family lipoprotein [Helicobacter ailurogastricus]CRF40707.1 Putative lipoprotein required for motility [Helicobacter ailurogastricus]CRF43100.1 Putative lipoprotein required for motility [Helicobacter ailurogastricus]CRF44329.1 Putative lipoprotein required for motility [Helicobacter ailurogastricus]CRF52201.1 Putative lipoprotein required for motility [Helicobacter ailurogastricus]
MKREAHLESVVGVLKKAAPFCLSVGLAAVLVGCGWFKKPGITQLIPPSATGLQAPIYPPTTFNNGRSNHSMPVFPKSPSSPQIETRFDNSSQNVAPSASAGESGMIANTPILTPTNVIELSAVGMGVAPESTISPSQALALAKRAAIVDGYRQLGEKMYGIRVNATDTVKDMILQNSVIKTKVNALIRNAEITETIYKDGLCQVSMELKLDGRIWYNVFNRARG